MDLLVVEMNQKRAPLLECLEKFRDKKRISFHVPGHKGGQCAGDDTLKLLGERVFEVDVTELPVTDDLHDSEGCIAEAQDLAAELFGAAKTVFTVNGATAGLQSCLLGLTKPGDTVIVSRAMHRSFWSGMVLAGVKPRYLNPGFLEDWGLWLPIDSVELENQLNSGQLVEGEMQGALFLTNPTYQGIAGDLERQIAIAHNAGLTVVVDEAHGPHFRFHSSFPKSAIEAGADVVVHSSHKYLGSLTQTAMVHFNKGGLRFLPQVLSALRILETSSPSFPLLGSLDGARRTMALAGQEMWEKALNIAAEFRLSIAGLSGIDCLSPKDLDVNQQLFLDPSKLVISGASLGLSGLALDNGLGERGIDVELATGQHVLCVLTPGNSAKDLACLAEALKDVASKAVVQSVQAVPTSPNPRVILTPREAYYSPTKQVPLKEARGKIAGELLCPYPPGTPVLCPGEEISDQVVDYLMFLKGNGQKFQGITDKQLEQLVVLDI